LKVVNRIRCMFKFWSCALAILQNLFHLIKPCLLKSSFPTVLSVSTLMTYKIHMNNSLMNNYPGERGEIIN
jgi:hypothetical protein